jgi:dynein intermediate chain 1
MMSKLKFQIKTGKNQFNFSERAAQTFNNILRSRGVATQPPPVVQFVATVTQWDIYDSYMQDIKAQQQEEENSKNAEKRKLLGSGECPSAQKKGKDDDMVHSTKMSNGLKILERMVNQNIEDEIFQDFKYWEDASDSYRNGEGSLLPPVALQHGAHEEKASHHSLLEPLIPRSFCSSIR